MQINQLLTILFTLSFMMSSPAFADNQAALEEALIAIDQERPDQALGLLKKIEPIDQKEAARVDQLIGEIYLQVGKPAKALDFFEQAATSIMEDGPALAGLAEASLGVGKLKQARVYAQSALREDHDLVRAHLVLARLETVSGSLFEAKKQLEKLFQQKAGNEDVAIAYATFLFEQREEKKALELLDGYTRKYTNSAKALDSLGQLYWMKGQERKAVRIREEAGKVYEKQGNAYRAETILNWVLEHKSKAKNKAKPVEADKPKFAMARQMEAISIPYGFMPHSTGSGVVIMEGKYVLTNHHVINGAAHLIVRNGFGEVRNAHVIKYSHMERDDMAVLELDQPFDPAYAVSLEMMGDPYPGRASIVMGYPLGSTLGVKMPSISEGAVSKTTGFYDRPNRFHSTARMNPGNSGGPVFDQYGNLIGLAVSKLNKMKQLKDTGVLPEDVNEAVKISRFFALMGMEGGQPLDTSGEDVYDLEELYQEMLPKTVFILNLVNQ